MCDRYRPPFRTPTTPRDKAQDMTASHNRWAYYVMAGRSWHEGFRAHSGFLSAKSKDEAVGAAIRETKKVMKEKNYRTGEWPINCIRVWQDTEHAREEGAW